MVTATVPIDRRGSVYTAWGDWLPAACWLLIGAGLLTGGWLGEGHGLYLWMGGFFGLFVGSFAGSIIGLNVSRKLPVAKRLFTEACTLRSDSGSPTLTATS